MLSDVRPNTSPKISITIYSGARAPEPAEACELEWSEIAAELAALANAPTGAPPTASVAEQKRCMAAWGPHALRPGTTRSTANVDHVSMLVLDVDHGADPGAIAERLADTGTAGLIYESASSTPEAPRFRVVAPVNRPIKPEECRATRIAFAEWLGLEPGCGVEGAVDASKLFFAGRLHGTPERLAEVFDGVPVNVDALPKPVLKWGSAKKAPELKPLEELPPANAGLAAALGDWTEHDGRKFDLCGAVGGMMRKLGYSAEQCAAELRAWLPADEPDVNVAAGVRYALRAWGLEPEQVSGHGKLAELLGLEHARVVETAAVERSPVRLAMPPRLRDDAPRVASAPGWTRPPSESTEAPIDPFAKVVIASNALDEPISYYCEGLRLAPSDGKISLIVGDPGSAKGPLADYLAVCFALGRSAFGRFACRKSRVLLLDSEGARLSRRRSHRMARALGVDPRELVDLHTLDVSPFDVTKEDFQKALQKYVEASGIDVVILDSYTSAVLASGVDSNQPQFANLARMLGSLDKLVIAVGHTRKMGTMQRGERPILSDVAGSFAFSSLAATAIGVWRTSTNRNVVNVGCLRSPETDFEDFEVEFADKAAGDSLSLSIVTAAEKSHDAAKDERAALSVRAGKVLTFFRTHAAAGRPLAASTIRQSGVHERDLSLILPAMVGAKFLDAHVDDSSKKQTLRYTLAGDAPTAVTFEADGTCRAAGPAGPESLAGFRRTAQ